MDESKLGFLEASDIYDFYGLTVVDKDSISPEQGKLYSFYLAQIRDKYVDSLKHRIRLEARFMGLELDVNSIANLVSKISKKLDEEVQRQAATMARTGAGFDMLSFIKAQQSEKKRDMDVAADAFRSKEGKSRPAFGGEPWAKISEAFLKVESAKTEKEIISSIDLLNSLAHNTCHVLFDLTNTRGSSGDDNSAIKEILDEKFSAPTPRSYARKMSPDVRRFLAEAGTI